MACFAYAIELVPTVERVIGQWRRDYPCSGKRVERRFFYGSRMVQLSDAT